MVTKRKKKKEQRNISALTHPEVVGEGGKW